jgi:hypothetical protein
MTRQPAIRGWRPSVGLLIGLTVSACAGNAAPPSAPASTTSPSVAAPSDAPSVPLSPSAEPPTSPPSLAVTWTPFASKRFAFSIEYPNDWTLTEGTADWPHTGWPDPDGHAVDRFSREPAGSGQVTVSSDVLAADEVAAGRRAEIDQETALVCTISGQTTTTLDGVVANRQDQFCFGKDHVIDVFAEHGGRIYLIYWLSKNDLTDADQALFAAMLARFHFEG